MSFVTLNKVQMILQPPVKPKLLIRVQKYLEHLNSKHEFAKPNQSNATNNQLITLLITGFIKYSPPTSLTFSMASLSCTGFIRKPKMNVIDQSHFTPVINLPNFKVYIRF